MLRRFGLVLAAPLAFVLVACGGTSATTAPTTTAPTVAATAAAPSTAPATAARSTVTAAAPIATAATPASATATTRATTAAASPATATRATVTRTAGTPATATRVGATPRTGTPGASGAIGTDETKTCQVGIPAGFTSVGGQDGAWTDRTALLILTTVPTNGQDFAAWTQTVASLLTSGSNPGTTIGAVDQRPDRYRVEFTSPADPTNPVIPYAASGTFVAVPATAQQVCAAELIFPQGQEATYASLAEGMVASLRPRQP
jgi:hypothetical protein